MQTVLQGISGVSADFEDFRFILLSQHNILTSICWISIFLVSSYTHGHSDINNIILLFLVYLFLQRGFAVVVCEENRYTS